MDKDIGAQDSWHPAVLRQDLPQEAFRTKGILKFMNELLSHAVTTITVSGNKAETYKEY